MEKETYETNIINEIENGVYMKLMNFHHINPEYSGKGLESVSQLDREIFEESWLKLNNTKLKGIIHFTNFFGKNGMMFITVSETKKTKNFMHR